MHPFIPVLALATGTLVLGEAMARRRWRVRLQRQYERVAGVLALDDYPPLVLVSHLGNAQYVVLTEEGADFHRVEVDAGWLYQVVRRMDVDDQLAVITYVLAHELAHVDHRGGSHLTWWQRQEQERQADRVGGDAVERLGLPLEPARWFASTIGSCPTCTHADGNTRYCDVTHGYHRGA